MNLSFKISLSIVKKDQSKTGFSPQWKLCGEKLILSWRWCPRQKSFLKRRRGMFMKNLLFVLSFVLVCFVGCATEEAEEEYGTEEYWAVALEQSDALVAELGNPRLVVGPNTGVYLENKFPKANPLYVQGLIIEGLTLFALRGGPKDYLLLNAFELHYLSPKDFLRIVKDYPRGAGTILGQQAERLARLEAKAQDLIKNPSPALSSDFPAIENIPEKYIRK
ncbi:MAG: hypothetical protein WCT18_00965 [Patescibacteria group bacterium]